MPRRLITIRRYRQAPTVTQAGREVHAPIPRKHGRADVCDFDDDDANCVLRYGRVKKEFTPS